MCYGLLSLIRAATSEPSMPTAFCASQWPCGSVLLGDFGIGGMLIGEGEAMLCQYVGQDIGKDVAFLQGREKQPPARPRFRATAPAGPSS